MDASIPHLELDSSTPNSNSNSNTNKDRSFISNYLLQFINYRSLNDWVKAILKLIPQSDRLDNLQRNGSDLWNVFSARFYISLSRPFVNLNRLINSDAYIYPIRGIGFFYQHPELWSSLQVVPPHFALSWMVYCLVWSTLFPMQFVLATIFGGPMGIVIASIATLQQCHYYSSFVTNKLLLPEQLDMVFDGLMILNDNYDVVLNGKLRRITPVPFVTKFRRFMWSIPTEFVFYPLVIAKMLFPTIYNSVPLLGPLIFSMANASNIGIGYQKRYFVLKNLKPSQIEMLNKKRMGHYASFGFIAGMLELTPVLGFIFEITNTVGAALWCADLEKNLNDRGFAGDRINTVRGLIEIMP